MKKDVNIYQPSGSKFYYASYRTQVNDSKRGEVTVQRNLSTRLTDPVAAQKWANDKREKDMRNFIAGPEQDSSNGELPQFYTPEEVAKALGLNRRTILDMIRRNEISAIVPVANRIRISKREVERVLQTSVSKISSPPKSDSRLPFTPNEVEVLKQVAVLTSNEIALLREVAAVFGYFRKLPAK